MADDEAMRSVMLVLGILAAFGATLIGAMKVMDSGDVPAAAARPRVASPTTSNPSPLPVSKPAIAHKPKPKPRQSAAERSGDRWVSQAESICGQFSARVDRLLGDRPSKPIRVFRKVYSLEHGAVARLHGLRRPPGHDGRLVDRLIWNLDRHVSTFDAWLDAMEAGDGPRIYQTVERMSALARSAESAAGELGAVECSVAAAAMANGFNS